jgi:hypothetical protein
MRWKLMAGNVLAVLIVGLAAWLVVRGQVADALSRDIDASVRRGVGLFSAMRTAEADRFTNVVAGATSRPDLQAVFANDTDSGQHRAAYEFAQHYAQDLAQAFGTPAHLVALTNTEGRVLARNIDERQDANRVLPNEFEVVRHALSDGGHVARDFLKYDNQRWYDVVVAPVMQGGQLRGLLLFL